MATLAEPSLSLRGTSRNPAALLILAMATAAAAIQTFVIPLDCDVSWLITASEKLLAGKRLYVDVIEPNPPASVWLYLPAVWLSARIGLPAEAVVAAAFIAAAVASMASTLWFAARLRQPPNPLLLAGAIGFVALVLPLGVFAQREHAALLLAFPMLAALAVLAQNRRLPIAAVLASGAAAGLLVVIKPHFLLVVVPAAAFAAWKARHPRRLAPAILAGAVVAAIYAAAILLATPEYLRLAPMLVELYLPLRQDWLTLLRGPVVIVPVVILALAAMLRPRRVAALPALLLIGAVGFALAGLVQAKGYLNHAFPAMALGLVALALMLVGAGLETARRRFVAAAGILLALLQLYALASIRPVPGLAEAVRKAAPARPSVITLGPDLLTGHPLVRHVGGRWAGSSPALFMAAGARRRLAGPLEPASREAIEQSYRADLAAFAADVARERPDVVLVDARPAVAWLRREAVIRVAMQPYRPAARAGTVEVWVRR